MQLKDILNPAVNRSNGQYMFTLRKRAMIKHGYLNPQQVLDIRVKPNCLIFKKK